MKAVGLLALALLVLIYGYIQNRQEKLEEQRARERMTSFSVPPPAASPEEYKREMNLRLKREHLRQQLHRQKLANEARQVQLGTSAPVEQMEFSLEQEKNIAYNGQRVANYGDPRSPEYQILKSLKDSRDASEINQQEVQRYIQEFKANALDGGYEIEVDERTLQVISVQPVQ